MAIKDWSDTADENSEIDGINIAEHCPAANLNDAIRQMMADAKSAYTDTTTQLAEALGRLTSAESTMAALGADSVHKTGDETISGVKTFTQTIAGTAAAAEKLTTARTITLSGAASGSVAFDGSADATLEVSIGVNQGAVIGEIRWFAMSTPPEGWLVCNGAAVGTSNYAALFAAIGNTFLPEDYPEEPGIFLLPDLMGKVPWGSTSVGTVIDAGLPNITGSATYINSDGVNQTNYPDTGCLYWGIYDHDQKTSTTNNGPAKRNLKFNASRSNSIYGKSSTVQPPALCLLPCIRYE